MTGQLFIVPNEVETRELIKTNYIYQIVTTGLITSNSEEVEIEIKDLETLKILYLNSQLPGEITLFGEDSDYFVDLLAGCFSLGKRKVIYKGHIAETYEELTEIYYSTPNQTFISISLKNVTIREEFENWLS